MKKLLNHKSFGVPDSQAFNSINKLYLISTKGKKSRITKRNFLFDIKYLNTSANIYF